MIRNPLEMTTSNQATKIIVIDLTKSEKTLSWGGDSHVKEFRFNACWKTPPENLPDVGHTLIPNPKRWPT